ncbi:MAG: alpha-L-fucosidase [Spirochaetales bacterium]|nr:alpha-L-fucosidase [Spirochaetales bacterium]
MKRLFLSILLCYMFNSTFAQVEFSNLVEIEPTDSDQQIIEKAAHIIPTKIQMDYLRNEYIAFIHFGVNTFNSVEWGTGFEDPAVFAPTALDTDQWCRIMKEAGMTLVVLTVKHHDGFCLWPTRYTDHSVASSPNFQNGQGDVLRELSKSAQKYGLKLGVYLSPADLYQIENPKGLYGNGSSYSDRVIPRPVEGRPFSNKKTFNFNVDDYNEYFLNQLFELLTEYGPVHEVWFDGAHPKQKGNQTYTYNAWYTLIRELAPEAAIFGKGPDVRWCGNEGGQTRQSEWNVIPLNTHPEKNSWNDLDWDDLGSLEQLRKGKFLYYLPAETNTSIRHGWFYRDDTTQQVRSAADILDIYERSVGGNSVFMLNIPPNRQGRFSPRDEEALIESGRRIREIYANNLVDLSLLEKNLIDSDLTTFSQEKEIIIPIQAGEKVNRLVIQEATPVRGQRVAAFEIDFDDNGQWKNIYTGTTIGYKKISRFATVETTRFRVRITDSRLEPSVAEVGAFFAPEYPPALSISRNSFGKVTITPVSSSFSWKGEGVNDNLAGVEIYYTLDGSDPSPTNGQRYTGAIKLEDGGRLKAAAYKNGNPGALSEKIYGLAKKNFSVRLLRSAKSRIGFLFFKMLDSNPQTAWLSRDPMPSPVVFDLKKAREITGFAWMPPQGVAGNAGMVSEGYFEISDNLKDWTKIDSYQFGNIINDPSQRFFYFSKPVTARYLKWVATTGAAENKISGAALFEILVTK